MILALSALKNGARKDSHVLDSWFQGEEAPKPDGQKAETAARQMLSWVHIRHSLKTIAHPSNTPINNSVPALPRFAREATVPAANPATPSTLSAPASLTPFQLLQHILSPNSRSSQWLAQYGWLSKFSGNQTYVDMSSTPDGGFNASLRAADGWRRTVVCRADGTSSQRISGPSGEEIIRFNTHGDPLRSSEVKRERELVGATA